MDHGFTFGILVEARYIAHAQPRGLCNALRERGHEVRVIDPDVENHHIADGTWLKGLDTVVARGRSHSLLSLLALAEARGARTVNRRCSIATVRDKAQMAVALARAGIPTPRTFVGVVNHLVEVIPPECYPIVVKPIFGDNCQGVSIVNTVNNLAQMADVQHEVLAQQYIPNDGFDLKLYGVGNEMWAIRKASPLHSTTALSTAVPLDDQMRDLGHRCRALFGLDLYGVDCITTPEGPLVIEVNDFPNYSGVSHADEVLARFVCGNVRRVP